MTVIIFLNRVSLLSLRELKINICDAYTFYHIYVYHSSIYYIYNCVKIHSVAFIIYNIYMKLRTSMYIHTIQKYVHINM